LPGKWWWTIKIGHPRDRPRLRSIFAKTALLCESVGVMLAGPVDLDELDRWMRTGWERRRGADIPYGPTS